MNPDPINMQGQTGAAQAAGAGATTPFLDHANNPKLSEKVRGYWKELEAKYVIPRLVREKYFELIELIKETESMNDEEREYWFQIMPIMTEDQLRKFLNILQNERKQLKKLDTEYQSEIDKLNDKHQVEWNAFEAKEKREQLKKQEAQHESEEKAKESVLLGKLDEL